MKISTLNAWIKLTCLSLSNQWDKDNCDHWNVETTTFIIIWVALCISISKTNTYTYMIVKYKVCRDEVDIQIRLPLKIENI